MKKTLFLLLSFCGCVAAYGQFQVDTLPVPLYDPLSDHASDFSDEEDYSGYFLPSQTGNNNYLPMGQLSRNLIGVRFRPRGIDNRYQRFEVNGAELSDPTDGFPYWNILSAIQASPNAHYDVEGLGTGMYGIGGAGGIVSLTTADRFLPSSVRLSYARTNRGYTDRLSVSASAIRSGWMLRGGASYRGGNDGSVSGLDNRRFSGAFSVGREFNKHTLNLLLAGYQSDQGVRSAATGEVYELADDRYYNPNWGYQNGRVRNSRRRGYTQIMSILSYEGKPDPMWTIRASASVFGGRNWYRLPAWYDSPTPYPDYYRYLPDFYANPQVSEPLREGWRTGDSSVTQIDWDKLYEANRYHFDANGIARSHYVLRDLVTDKRNLAFSFSTEYRPDSRLTARFGAGFRSDDSDNYGRMNDLLGGSYWLDIDQYLIDDEYYGGMYRNDLRNPDRPVFVGDRFGYSYRMRSTTLKGWASVDYRTARWSVSGGVETGRISFRREGGYEKEMFPGNLSYGKSQKIDFQEYMLKGGVFCHISLRHRIGVRMLAGAQAPLVKNLFVAPSYRNEIIADPEMIRITAVEAIWQWISPQFSVNLTGYATQFSGECEIRNFYDDIESEYMNLALTGIDKIHGGVELGAEWNAAPRLSLLGVISAGVYKYDNDPRVTLYRDSDGKILLSGAQAFMSGYFLPGTPQRAAMLQLNFRTRSYWRFELSGKYTSRNYVSMNPVRRMGRALDLAGSPEIKQEMALQERLDNAFLLSLSVSKTFRLRNGNRVGLWVNADNLLDNKDIRYSGYEQWRFTRTSDGAGRTLRPFASKYYYAYGAYYYAMLSYTF